MKLLNILLVTLLAGAAAVPPAVAGPGRDLGSGRFDILAQRQRTDEMPPQPQRDLRRDERQPERDPRRDGRLTDEERRDLRRDIDRANREIYKGRQ